jgi:hypothetical protein
MIYQNRMRWLPLLSLLVVGCGPPRWSTTHSSDRVPLSLWAASPSQVFASGGALGSGGAALFLRYDGGAWKEIQTGTDATLWWVHGLSANDVWLVGERGTILRWNGQSLEPETSGTDRTLYGIWGARPDDMWAVGGRPGQDGVVLHRDATGWTTQPVPRDFVTFFKVWGTAANDVFACGEGGTIVHWDGGAWTRQETGLPDAVPLFTVAGRAANDVYAVGGFGRAVALRYDGAAWSPLTDPIVQDAGSLAGVSVASDGTVVIVGAAGTKLRGKPGAFVDQSDAPPRADLHAAYAFPGEAFAVGGNYLAPAPAAREGVVAQFR